MGELEDVLTERTLAGGEDPPCVLLTLGLLEAEGAGVVAAVLPRVAVEAAPGLAVGLEGASAFLAAVDGVAGAFAGVRMVV
jgi:hypothetical protein